VVRGGGAHDVARGGDHFGLDEIVDGEPVLAHEPPDSAPEAQAPDPRVAHNAAGGCEAVLLRLMIDTVARSASTPPL
jgi:hypothetical protein